MSHQSTEQNRSPNSFHLFTRLPAELRLSIYALSLPEPRLVPLVYQSTTYSGGTPIARRPQWGCTSSAQIPAFLHVCRESRAYLARRFYSLSFNPCGSPGVLPPKVWFAKDGADMVYFGPREGLTPLDLFQHFVHLVSVIGRQELSRIRRMAVHESLFMLVEQKSRGFDTAKRTASGQPDLLLKEFWDYVQLKFRNVEEVIFVRSGHEELLASEVASPSQLSPYQSHHYFIASAETFMTRISRAANVIEFQESNWIAPAWRILGHDDVSTMDCKSMEVEPLELYDKVDCMMSRTEAIFGEYMRQRNSLI